MFEYHRPAHNLASYVLGYWFVSDLAGAHGCTPIQTAPSTATILTLHFGKPDRSHDGAPVPAASLLGPQPASRSWHSAPETRFVMAMITPAGMARLFPGEGQALATNLVDLGAIIGDRAAYQLLDVASGFDCEKAVGELDRWFNGRLNDRRPDIDKFAAACAMFTRHRKIGSAAEMVGLSIRQLQRLSAAFVGISPKQIYEIDRLRVSLAAVQTGSGDPLAGFVDQSHQIRTWKKRLFLTPTAYVRRGQSLIRRSITAPERWTHYL